MEVSSPSFSLLSVFLSSDAARSLARIEHAPSLNGIGIRWWVVVVPKSKRTCIHAPSRHVAIVAEQQHLNSDTCVVRFSVSQRRRCACFVHARDAYKRTQHGAGRHACMLARMHVHTHATKTEGMEGKGAPSIHTHIHT
ncbi:hypothetical protein IWX47DRAFT_864882 [Phyllosticta citricarpa]